MQTLQYVRCASPASVALRGPRDSAQPQRERLNHAWIKTRILLLASPSEGKHHSQDQARQFVVVDVVVSMYSIPVLVGC